MLVPEHQGDGEPGREGEKEMVKWKNRKGERKLIEKREWRLEKGGGDKERELLGSRTPPAAPGEGSFQTLPETFLSIPT